MTSRINCPSCEAPNTVDEEKRGSKVRCRKCKETFAVPNGRKKRADEDAVQDGRKLKSKTAVRAKADDDDDDDRPTPRKQAAKGEFPIVLVLGGVAVLFLFLLIGGGAIGGFRWYRAAQADVQVAKVEEKKDEAAKNKEPKGVKPEEAVGPDNKKAPDIDEKPEGPEPDVKKVPEPEKPKDPDPEIKKKPDPEVKKDPEPLPPKVDPLAPDLQKVRRATVQVRALQPSGTWLEGSGFFVESNLIVTNAHVLGMLDPKAPPPTRVEVVLNGGEANESTVSVGYTVDRASDLAVLGINGFNLPAPLTFEDPGKFTEKQKVHLAGYPFGRKDRKDPTINATEITSIKKDAGGNLEEIQVKGGMNPGNSGGPVVTAEGKVVGVALGAVTGTDVHLAIPAETVKRLLNGKVGDVSFANARTLPSKVLIDVSVALIDPKLQIKEARIEVFTGTPTPARHYSYNQPTPLPGDGERTTTRLIRGGNAARIALPMLEAIPKDQVVWVQPVIVLKDNSMQWGAAAILPPPPTPYDRKPFNLTANLQAPKERTVKLKYTRNAVGKAGLVSSRGDVDILEVLAPVQGGTKLRTVFGSLNLSAETDPSKFLAIEARILDRVRAVPTTYGLDATGKLVTRDYRQFTPDVPTDQRDAALELLLLIGAAYESTLAPVPNREVQPGETWTTTGSVMVLNRAMQKAGPVEMALNNTYEGILVKAKRTEAIFTATGKLRSFAPEFKSFDADVSAKIGFDVAGGFISSAKIKLTSVPGAAKEDVYSFEIDLQRTAGNTKNIQMPTDPKTKTDPPPVVGKGKKVLDQRANLTLSDKVDPALSIAKKKAHYKEFKVDLEMGKTYTMELKSTQFDPVLKVFGPANNLLAQNGASGTARIMFRAPASGTFHLFAIGGNHKTGAFHLTVMENP